MPPIRKPQPAVQNPQPEPWDILEGEARWYDRFLRYLEQGRGRSLYRAYLADREMQGAQGEPSPNTPYSWRKAAERFDWEARARAWDDHRSAQIRDRFETTHESALQLASEAVQVLEDLLRSDDPVQRRIAAKSILGWLASMHRYASREAVEEPLPPIKYVEVYRVERTDMDEMRSYSHLLDDRSEPTGEI